MSVHSNNWLTMLGGVHSKTRTEALDASKSHEGKDTSRMITLVELFYSQGTAESGEGWRYVRSRKRGGSKMMEALRILKARSVACIYGMQMAKNSCSAQASIMRKEREKTH